MTLQRDVIIALILVVLMSVGLSWGVNYISDLQKASAQNEGRGEILNNASAGITRGEVVDTKQAEVATSVANGREQFKITIQEAKRNEPETADRANRAVPVSVRRAYGERRRARERLGCVGEQCEEGRESR